MRTHFSNDCSKAVEMCSQMPSQTEPDGATDLREVVRQYMSGVQQHTPQQYYYDFDAAVGGIPDLDSLEQIPRFDTIEQVDEWLQEMQRQKQSEASSAPPAPAPAPPAPAPPAPAPAPPAPAPAPAPAPPAPSVH